MTDISSEISELLVYEFEAACYTEVLWLCVKRGEKYILDLGKYSSCHLVKCFDYLIGT